MCAFTAAIVSMSQMLLKHEKVVVDSLDWENELHQNSLRASQTNDERNVSFMLFLLLLCLLNSLWFSILSSLHHEILQFTRIVKKEVHIMQSRRRGKGYAKMFSSWVKLNETLSTTTENTSTSGRSSRDQNAKENNNRDHWSQECMQYIQRDISKRKEEGISQEEMRIKQGVQQWVAWTCMWDNQRETLSL